MFRSLLVLCSLLLAAPSYAQDDAAPWNENILLGYLEQLIHWHREAAFTTTTTENAREVLLRDTIGDTATRGLQYGFTFARQAGAVLDAQAPSGVTVEDNADKSTRERQEKFAAMVAENEQQLARLRDALPRLRGRAHEQASMELRFAQSRQKLYATVQSSSEQVGLGEQSGVAGKIANMARSVPEASKKRIAASASTTATAAPAPDASDAAAGSTAMPASEGMIHLIGTLLGANRKQNVLRAFMAETDTVMEKQRALLTTLRAEMDRTAQQAIALTGDGAQRDRQQQLVAQHQALADSIVPLVNALRAMDTVRHTTQSWNAVVQDQTNLLLRQLLLRLVVLAMAVAVPLLLSDLGRRAVARYVRDPKRVRQLHTLRRALTIIAVGVVILMNFVTEFGSFATFAGFLTAGLAVALQSVLVSLVAHFFFYGRYGVRAGDIINVAGVTGEIVQIGMMRLYLREMDVDGERFVPTGKTVAFPNSILFQPTAFYKYVGQA